MCQILLDSAKSNETYPAASGSLLTSEIDTSTAIVLDRNKPQKVPHKFKSLACESGCQDKLPGGFSV